MKLTIPFSITFVLLSTLVASSPSPAEGGKFIPIARGSRVDSRRAVVAMYPRQSASSDSGDGSTTSGDGLTTSGDDTGSEDGDTDSDATAAAAAEATATYTYDGSGGQEQDGGPSLTAVESGSTPAANDLTSATAANAEATSADPNAQPSAAPSASESASESSSHSGLTNYNTTTRSATGSVSGTSAAQTSATSSQAASAGSKSALPNLSPFSLITVVIAGGLGAMRILV
ncbi:uncharacterized protein IL334_004225 [Kwoniella shivajii]|uniref:Uncharacterized protein n=1 Tax=Kwoniella shivajii TaxID=564305 RepID=A0ABZ1D0B9_9TREE|nr:hypothetical protein IL334_004225 [Kwoniella shivajii]